MFFNTNLGVAGPSPNYSVHPNVVGLNHKHLIFLALFGLAAFASAGAIVNDVAVNRAYRAPNISTSESDSPKIANTPEQKPTPQPAVAAQQPLQLLPIRAQRFKQCWMLGD